MIYGKDALPALLRLCESPIELQLASLLFEIKPRESGNCETWLKFAYSDPFPDVPSESHFDLFLSAQAPIGPYRADFLFTAGCNDVGVRVAVECDGLAYHSDPDQMEHDAIRDRYFARHGIRTIRLTGREILRHPEECSQRITAAIDRAHERARDISYNRRPIRGVA